jgi:ABC-type nitrate/sulfonate/bicarbonate transport system permease component
MGRWKTVEDIVDPLVSMLRPIPPIAWIPLGILWFGIGENEKVFVIWWAAFFPILVNSISGVRGIDKIYVSAILTMGGNEKQVLKDVVFWGSLPSIFVGLRLGLGNAWMALVAGELVAASSGLGFMMQNARQYLATDKVIIGMILIGILGLSMDIGMRYLLKRLMPWVEGLKIG